MVDVRAGRGDLDCADEASAVLGHEHTFEFLYIDPVIADKPSILAGSFCRRSCPVDLSICPKLFRVLLAVSLAVLRPWVVLCFTARVEALRCLCMARPASWVGFAVPLIRPLAGATACAARSSHRFVRPRGIFAISSIASTVARSKRSGQLLICWYPRISQSGSSGPKPTGARTRTTHAGFPPTVS